MVPLLRWQVIVIHRINHGNFIAQQSRCLAGLTKKALIGIALALHPYQNRYRGTVSPMKPHPFHVGVTLG